MSATESKGGATDAAEVVVNYLRSRRPDIGELDPDLDLIENRVLDSLHFVEFLYVLEEATGREIPLEQVSPEHFRTLARIKARFLDGDQG